MRQQQKRRFGNVTEAAIRPCSRKDRTLRYERSDGGSIPSEGTKQSTGYDCHYRLVYRNVDELITR